MPLAPGTRLGRYEIRSLIGAGGMGEVYRALDASLKRDVAIKVLPAEFTNDPERLRRFQQEALATAALNHPHIVAVHDVGTHESTAFVVTELLEGRTLKEVMAAGPVPVRKAVDYATQIASGLAAAHEKGIVHRDLKPANLFVTKDERVKILDFGLARMMAASPSDQSATATVPGSVLGTVGYMAPEQVRGEPADYRADIFAFGVILYEMLSGRRAFQRESVPGTLAAILHDEPPTWTGDGTSLSLRLMRLVHRCLEKAPAARFQSARDLMLVLSDEVSDPSRAAEAPVAPRRRTALIAGAVVGAVVFTFLGAWLGSRVRSDDASLRDSAARPTTIPLRLPDGETLASNVPAISRDGGRLAYVLRHGATDRLYTYRVETAEWQLLPGTEGAKLAFFSPDGRQIGFLQAVGEGATLKRIRLDGSRPIDICDCDGKNVRGASWGDDDRIVLGTVFGSLRRVASTGGAVEAITTVDQDTEVDHRYPVVLPGATRVVFTVTPKELSSRTRVAASVIGSGRHVMLLDDGRSAEYAAGRLVFVKRVGEVHAVPFDPDALKLTGAPFALSERPAGGNFAGDTSLRLSAEGTASYVPLSPSLRRLVVADRRGTRSPVAIDPARYSQVQSSRNGQRLLFSTITGLDNLDVFVLDLSNGKTTRFTDNDNSRYPIWGPEDSSVIYSVRGGAEEKVYSRDIDVTGRPSGNARLLFNGTANASAFSIADRMLLFGAGPPTCCLDMWRLLLDKPSERSNVLELAQEQFAPSVSPNRKWLAYTSNEKGPGQWEVYVTSYPTPGRLMKIADGQTPGWSRSGNELFFTQGGKLFSARVTAVGPAPGTATPIGIEGIVSSGPGLPGYSELPNGTFVIITQDPEPANARTPIVVLNWASQLKNKK